MAEPVSQPRPLRLFIAIAIPAPIRAELAPTLEQVARLAPHAKVVPLDNLHVTLRFLGATAPTERARIEAALENAARGQAGFEAELSGSGSFGPPAAPTVLYAGLGQSGPAITELAARVSAALQLPRDERYTPHVSLARAKGSKRGDRDLARAREALASFAGGRFGVGSLALMQSQVSHLGAHYRILRETPFPA